MRREVIRKPTQKEKEQDVPDESVPKVRKTRVTPGPGDEEERHDPALIRERVREELRRFFRKRTQRRPMVIPVVMEV